MPDERSSDERSVSPDGDTDAAVTELGQEVDADATLTRDTDSAQDSNEHLEQHGPCRLDADASEMLPDEPEVAEPVEVEEDAFELEELTLPSEIARLDPLPAGAAADAAGMVIIEQLIEQRGQINRYSAVQQVGDGESRTVDLHEGPVDHAGMMRVAEVLEQVQYAMLPRLYGTWEEMGRRYLALEAIDAPTLSEALAEGMDGDAVISTVLQLVQVVRRLHSDGWALVGLTPDNVRMGKPIRVMSLGTATRIGAEPATALHVPGYSAPELAQRSAVTGKEDVFTLAAMLYHGLSGEYAPVESPELLHLAATVRTPGAPQVIAAGLAPAERRADLETFYQALLGLRRRRSRTPLALQVASGTSIGLNDGRQANEDACGYLTWSVAYEGRVAYNAMLCVIDGMGGMEAGEVAATAALRSVLRDSATFAAEQVAAAGGADLTADAMQGQVQVQESTTLSPRDLVRGAAEGAYAAARGRSVGATITCAVIEDGRLTLGHVGDTRAYLLRDTTLTQLTRDHSLVAAMVASGTLSKEEARHHPESNKVLRSLGGMRTLPEEYVDSLAVAHGAEELALRDGDQLLLCSDGVWGELDDSELQQILETAPDSAAAVEQIIRRVLEEGAADNAAVIIARCVTMPAQ